MEKISNLYIWHPKFKRTSKYYNNGETETYYLGTTSSPKQFCIYNKGAEIKAKNTSLLIKEEVPAYSTTRVEARIRDRIPLKKLSSIHNPFKKLGVSKYGSPHPTSWEFNLFLKLSNECGSQEALLSLPEAVRKKYRLLLSQKTPSWWEHKSIWAQAPQLFKNLTIQPSAYKLNMFSCTE